MPEKKSVVQKIKKTLRPKSKNSETGKKKNRSEASTKSTRSKRVAKRKAATNRKKSTSFRKTASKESTVQKGSTRGSVRRDAEPTSRMGSVRSTVDAEEDADWLVPTPDLMVEIRKEELKEKTEKEKKEKEKEKEKSKESKKSKRKEKEKKDSNREPTSKMMEQGDEKTNASKKEKPRQKIWLGMTAALNFFEKHRDIRAIREEFNFLDSLVCNKTTDAFDANTVRNRAGCPKIYDDNRIRINRPGQEAVNYINASLITMKDFNHKLIVAQLPQLENDSFVEDFWHMIYQEQINLVYLMVPDNHFKSSPTSFFKEESGGYQYVGKMFINNRKSDVSGDPKEYTIEVLPEGNSDAVICQVHHHSLWKHLQQPPKTRPIIKMIHQFLTDKLIQNTGVCVVSVFGCGRACSFIGALYAISQLNNGVEPDICEIMKDIKQQRPGATESFAQYASIYAVVLDYISRKRGSKKDPINKDINRFIEELTDITPADSPVKTKPAY